MNRKRAGWGIALLLTLVAGCATGTNQQLVMPNGTPARSGGGPLASFRRRDPMQAQAVPARVQPPGTPDPRLTRFFPGIGQRGEVPVASRPGGRQAPSAGGPAYTPGPTRAAAEAPDEPISTLPVALTVGLRTPPLPQTNVPPMVDPAVVPAATEVVEAEAKPPSLLPGDLSFSPPDELHVRESKDAAPAQAAVASEAADGKRATPAPAAAPQPAATPAETPRYVEPMLVVSDPPSGSGTAAPSVVPPAAEAPAGDAVPAPPPAPALPAPGSEPGLEPKTPAAATPAPASAAVPTGAENKPDPDPSTSPSAPSRAEEHAPQVAAADGPRSAPTPAATLPEPPAAPASPLTPAPAESPVPTVASVPIAPQAQATVQPCPPVPSKQMPQLSPPTQCVQTGPPPRPRSLTASWWPNWLRPETPAGHSPAPRPALAASRRPARPVATPGPAPRPMLTSLWPTWLRSGSLPAPAGPPARTNAPASASATAPVRTAGVRPQVVHAHGCPHHACQSGEASPWYGVNRSLEVAGMFPPTYYETMVKRAGVNGEQPFSAPPAPTLAAVRNPGAAPTPPATAAPAPSPVVAVAPAPAAPAAAPAPGFVPQPRPKRVWLITRVWNRIHGNSESTVPPAPARASVPGTPPAAAVAVVAVPEPAPANAAAAAAPPSRNAVTGDLPQAGEPVERVSAERVDEPAQR